jgi:aspartate/methionine/tyrosine aminotransferase
MKVYQSQKPVDTPIDFNIVRRIIQESRLVSIGKSSIREIVKLVNDIEKASGERFLRMEMGVPGLPAVSVGVEAEIEALRKGVASIYPMVEGVPVLKQEISRFVKLFLDLDIDPSCCIPTAGSVMGSMASFLVANRNDRNREGTLFLDPGFPVQKQQCRVLGQDFRTFDVYNYRGKKLEKKLESYLSTGKVSSILYSNPNNPTWICFNGEELEIIGRLASLYDVIVIEDLAYFGMDFRQDVSHPGQPPYQPTVANYTDHYILLISSSKVFSYAGQRVGMMAISPALFNREYPDLLRYYTSSLFGHDMIYGAIYSLSSGCSHSAQYGIAAILKAVNDGTFNFVESLHEYEERAHILKSMFQERGFSIVYDRDLDQPLADGFYFTISYPGFTGAELVEELLYYGIGSISLDITCSERTEGLRACVSQIGKEMFGILEDRLVRFRKDHPVGQ